MILGLVMGIFPSWGLFLNPLITALQLIPGLAWVPITLILFGLGPGATVFMIAATALSPVVINTRTGVEQIGPGLLRAAAMMELSPGRIFFRVILPGAAPSLVSGLRIGAANGFRVLISAEMVVGTGLGLGYSLYQSRWTLDYASSFAALLLIVLIGLILERLVFVPLEERVCRRRGLI
jgi:ABC-type nitrate/sulfonate/bicarbonate transport system permease component